MNYGWQSESTDGLKRWLELFFEVVTMVAVITWPDTSQLRDVVWCSAAVVVGVV